ncbi:phage tail assembly chaperone [Clostridioides difficile]
MLTPGEYTDLSSEVGEVNGFDRTFEDKVEEAKN